MLKSSDELLELKVADIACGSGAFLVASARYLAERVVEAWTVEDPANARRQDLYRRAIRQVVANCLYGADINDMAVEMCKLSLWLVSLDRDLPFSFVDDKVFLGNSLLGLTNLDQLRKLHIDKRATLERLDYLDVDIDATIRKAIGLRERLATEIDEDDPARNSAAKRRQLAELRRVTADLRRIADGVVAAGLPLGGKPGKALDEAYVNLRLAVKKAYPGPTEGEPDTTWLDGLSDRGLTPTVPTDYDRWQPLHWILEAPDVLVERGGFDAIVGNPPFLGAKRLTAAVSTDVRDWLVATVANHERGNADLVAYFMLRAFSLLHDRGTLGLVATNTVAQGDTREVGLDQLDRFGLTLTRAVRSAPWPASSANLEYAATWGARGPVEASAERVCDGAVVTRISTLLEPGARVFGAPTQLHESKGRGFIGCVVLGGGFILEPATARGWIDQNPRYGDVLYPYLNGEDLNSTADTSARRWIIDFNDRGIDQARQYPLAFDRVNELVRPQREQVRRETYKRRWWQFAERVPGMRAATADLSEVLVIAQVSRTLMPVRVKTGQVFDAKLIVFATASYSDQSVLSSSLHQLWATKYGTTMRQDPTYTPTAVLETFPFPSMTARLEESGRRIDQERRDIMLRRVLGLTKLYNLVNNPSVPDSADPDVARMRAIHVELDEAVMDAYGWSDIPLDHGFHTYRQMERWTVSPAARVEILDLLLEENHRRAAAEAAAGTSASKGRKSKTASGAAGSLF